MNAVELALAGRHNILLVTRTGDNDTRGMLAEVLDYCNKFAECMTPAEKESVDAAHMKWMQRPAVNYCRVPHPVWIPHQVGLELELLGKGALGLIPMHLYQPDTLDQVMQRDAPDDVSLVVSVVGENYIKWMTSIDDDEVTRWRDYCDAFDYAMSHQYLADNVGKVDVERVRAVRLGQAARSPRLWGLARYRAMRKNAVDMSAEDYTAYVKATEAERIAGIFRTAEDLKGAPLTPEETEEIQGVAQGRLIS